MNGARHESPFTLDDLDTSSAEQKHQSSAASQESENGKGHSINGNGNGNGSSNGNGNGSQHSTRGMSAPRAGDLLDSMDASDLWLDAGALRQLAGF